MSYYSNIFRQLRSLSYCVFNIFQGIIPVLRSLNQVKEFDSISRLDQWLTTMLLRIKKSIQGDGEGDGDLKWSADLFVACSSFLFSFVFRQSDLSGMPIQWLNFVVNKPHNLCHSFSSPCLCYCENGKLLFSLWLWQPKYIMLIRVLIVFWEVLPNLIPVSLIFSGPMVNVAMCFSFFPKLWYSTQFYRCFAKTLCIGIWMDPLYKWFSLGWLLGISF